jgi:8-oxo-dGTP pyrophosphatase MutT (NUDIX family)
MHVYPGGAVEPSDSVVPLALTGDLADVATRFGTDDPVALVAAAVRETFEECGVLLALDGDGAPAVVSGALERDRAELTAGRLGFADLLDRHGLGIDDGAVIPFAHWVTPEVEDRRFDTHFFVAALPADADARELGGEADHVVWLRPTDAIAAWESGTLPMLPPTVSALRELGAHPDVAAILAAARVRSFVPLLPTTTVGADGEVEWGLVHAVTRELVARSSEPPASETDGTAS